jgi:hypothetical protein
VLKNSGIMGASASASRDDARYWAPVPKCQKCHGLGKLAGGRYVPCCGSGRGGSSFHGITCDKCMGTNRVWEEAIDYPCDECGGTGHK